MALLPPRIPKHDLIGSLVLLVAGLVLPTLLLGGLHLWQYLSGR